MRKLYLMLIPALWICSGCTKTVSSEDDATKKKADEFRTSITTHRYKPVAFYSDKPIDYITDDNEVKSETELWGYVKDYIKDDVNQFNDNGKVTVYQNAVKLPGNDAATFTYDFEVGATGKDIYFKFVDYNYVPTTYKLEEFNDAYFTVYLDGPAGSKLFSKFARVE